MDILLDSITNYIYFMGYKNRTYDIAYYEAL